MIDIEILDYDYVKYAYTLNDNVFNGSAYEILPDGGLELITIIDGKKNGVFREWDKNGEIIVEECYFNNSLHGHRLEWNGKGELLKEEVYQFGELTLQISVSETGQKEVLFQASDETANHLDTVSKGWRVKPTLK